MDVWISLNLQKLKVLRKSALINGKMAGKMYKSLSKAYPLLMSHYKSLPWKHEHEQHWETSCITSIRVTEDLLRFHLRAWKNKKKRMWKRQEVDLKYLPNEVFPHDYREFYETYKCTQNFWPSLGSRWRAEPTMNAWEYRWLFNPGNICIETCYAEYPNLVLGE